ncbi:MAG: uracil-DNA glycosylase [Woeseiaceae bacterium]
MLQSEHQRRAYLEALGIDVWVRNDLVDEPVAADDAQADAASMDWTELGNSVAACTRCELHKSRTQTVFGVGNRDADWLIIGEAPGAEEDRRGEPFVGRAGKLLDEMLRAAGQDREQVFIANILKCRPPNNRDPEADEAGACRSYLDRQIALLKPKIILAVGRIAAQTLLATDTPVGKLRGTVHQFGDVPMVVTYHPAYLLRSPTQKSKSWQDLCLAMDVAAGSSA